MSRAMKRVSALLLLMALAGGCHREAVDKPADSPAARNAKGSVSLTFTYGSEKEEWIKDVTTAFNAEDHRLLDGRTIVVERGCKDAQVRLDGRDRDTGELFE
jgi:ABC-type sugar transport system substrate-binding protein